MSMFGPCKLAPHDHLRKEPDESSTEEADYEVNNVENEEDNVDADGLTQQNLLEHSQDSSTVTEKASVESDQMSDNGYGFYVNFR